MQELLGRLSQLDPQASQSLRVIACFDELISGKVNTRALLSAAAALAGCNAGFRDVQSGRALCVTPAGELTGESMRPTATALSLSVSAAVWLSRDGDPRTNDAIILERLALAVRLRSGASREGDQRRELAILVDGLETEERRYAAAARIGLSSAGRYRLAAAPLFAIWQEHPDYVQDVVPTSFGPIHALVVPDGAPLPSAAPLGLGLSTQVSQSPISFRTAVVALRLCDPPVTSLVCADEYGDLAALLVDAHTDAPSVDTVGLNEIMDHPWAVATIDALLRASSLRQAARLAQVHHSTMQARVDKIAGTLGYNPVDGLGRTRLGVAYLVWRLQHSHVLDLPASGGQLVGGV